MKIRKPRGFWNKENCGEESLKYTQISDFKRNSGSAYNSAKSNNWLSGITAHMINIIKPVGYWNKENCEKEALKYETKTEFKNNSGGAYDACKENGWINDVSKHMRKIGHRYNKCVYVYEFSDNSAYVGITYDIERRKHDRNKNPTDSVTKHITKTQLLPTFKQLTDYVNVNDAVKLEEYYVELYRKNNWNILNQCKTGSIGKVNIWTKEKCIDIAKKCKTRTEFYKQSKGAYDAARRYGWVHEIYLIVGL